MAEKISIGEKFEKGSSCPYSKFIGMVEKKIKPNLYHTLEGLFRSPKFFVEKGVEFSYENLQENNRNRAKTLNRVFENLEEDQEGGEKKDDKSWEKYGMYFDQKEAFKKNLSIPTTKSYENEKEKFYNGSECIPEINESLAIFFTNLVHNKNEVSDYIHLQNIVKRVEEKLKMGEHSFDVIKKEFIQLGSELGLNIHGLDKVKNKYWQYYITQFLKLQERFFNEDEINQRNSFVEDNGGIEKGLFHFQAQLVEQIAEYFSLQQVEPTQSEIHVLDEIAHYDERNKQRIPNPRFIKAIVNNTGPILQKVVQEGDYSKMKDFLKETKPLYQVLLFKAKSKRFRPNKYFLRPTACPASKLIDRLLKDENSLLYRNLMYYMEKPH